MGYEQVKAAGLYSNGLKGKLAFESFPYCVSITTQSATDAITDSAAAATALATGRKVANGVISMAIPGNGRPLETILERLQAEGKSTGLVTTAYVTHATPAAYGAHEPKRTETEAISLDYLQDSKPAVLFGGAKHLTRARAEAAGYLVVSTRAGLLALDTEKTARVSGQFGHGHMPYEYDRTSGQDTAPNLSEMTTVALRILDNDPDGFFLMVEGGRIDHAGHDNNLARNVAETLELNRAVMKALEWARDRDDTLILVTADHETGGLKVIKNRGKGVLPEATWSTRGHTSSLVPLCSWGTRSELVMGVKDNTGVFKIINKAVSAQTHGSEK